MGMAKEVGLEVKTDDGTISEKQGMELDTLSAASSPDLPRHQSDKGISTKEFGYGDLTKANSTPSLPGAIGKRHVSIQDEKDGSAPKTSAHRPPRKSVEFDRRTDGPFGRPSLTMARRGSQQHGALGVDGEVPSVPPHFTTDGDSVHPQPTNDSIPFQSEPPPLNYDLWSRRWWIAGFWFLVVFDSVVCPIALYFGLWYGLYLQGRMSANTVFSIVTAAVGGMSIIEYFIRLWKLVWKKSTCRVMDAKWWHGDFFHWNFTIGWLIIMVELIVGTVQHDPPPRLITMVVPTMLYVFGIELLTLDLLRYFQIPAPIRLSSIPKGAQVRPGIYTIIEDVVAVDGSGGTVYREALNLRYEASHVFRAMLRRLGLFWSIGAVTMAVICTILIFTVEVDAAYTIGWALPFLWAGVWTLITFWYVKKKLREEKVAWREEIEEKTAQGA